jgi:protein-L-isoaspartate(D-aspartate) O-methyltransferase
MPLSENELAARRKSLVDALAREGYLTKGEVISAMTKVPRHIFVPRAILGDSYCDCPLGIGDGQTISAPHMVAIMCEKLNLVPGNRVLEIGSGSGYHAAVVAEIIGEKGQIYTVERIPSLAESARESISKCGLSGRVTVIVGDGSKGFPEKAPYDRIYVTASSPSVPKPLVEQLKDGGRMLVPVGSRFYQELIAVTKQNGKIATENHGGCVFVPLLGEHGHK